MARRSATECAAILDACRVTNLADWGLPSRSRTLLLRRVATLTAMVLRLRRSGLGLRLLATGRPSGLGLGLLATGRASGLGLDLCRH
ncbi:MAG: hypothetical protein JW751_29825 [Polyangiaceae bacterium]|nr:hypothetical protein [Polyangiaceae bacterium]